ncbi:hemerythrin domain-containing protein [Herbidospora cretacea]|uniref:hemerythrin domain-containing protein n=1 Tax=Herbidospora cretacea TaxID=28444 RepID=UPI000774066C|nr:hemerythrin domain-containing protein [Herbidospora cretacea]
MSLLSELTFVHNMLRRDLAEIRRMAESAAAGGDLAEVRKGLVQLSSATLFPRIRRIAPDLNAAVDRLEADHAAVSGLLDEVGAAARDAESRERLVKALDALADRFLEHLAYEEEALGAVLSTMRH